MNFGTVAILGPGLIGGSLALALAERGLVDRLVIYARKDTSFSEIKKKLPQATLTTDVAVAVRDADIVVLCVPIETMAGLVQQFVASLKPAALVTDVGSVKESVDRELAPLLEGKALWIGSHPMAGSEKAGFSVARADLFDRATVILAPTKHTELATKNRLEKFWRELGSEVFSLTPKEHDQIVAEISHLPHLVASSLVISTGSGANTLKYVGSGFRDVTRIALGSPALWAEILLANRTAVIQSIDHLSKELVKVQKALEKEDKPALLESLQLAHDLRSHIPPKNP